MDILTRIQDKARAARRTLVLPEGTEERTIIAARSLAEESIAKVVLLGDKKQIGSLAETHGLDVNRVQIITPRNRLISTNSPTCSMSAARKKG